MENTLFFDTDEPELGPFDLGSAGETRDLEETGEAVDIRDGDEPDASDGESNKNGF